MSKTAILEGARWFKFDLHTHTPESDDYRETGIDPRKWLMKLMSREIDCVAITDHDSFGWIEKLRKELNKMEENKPEGFRSITLFPGIEITSPHDTHILAVFSPDISTDDLGKIHARIYSENGKSSTGRYQTKKETQKIFEMIRKEGGLGIAAHVDLEEKSCVLKEYSIMNDILQKDVLAVELSKRRLTVIQQWKELKKHNCIGKFELIQGVCHVNGSDAHYVDHLGTRYTWVKMGETPSLDGLKLALSDFKHSIKLTGSSNPNEVNHTFIERLVVKSAKNIGNGASFCCKFSPWMNSFIGGRGTGKSSLIEFLRVGMGQIRKDHDEDLQIYYKPDEGNLVTRETIIEVYFWAYESHYCARWRGQDDKLMICTEEDGKWIDSPGSISGRFPVLIYSQKELFKIAKNKKCLLEIVDNSDDIKIICDEIEKQKRQCIACYQDMQANEREINNEDNIKGDLKLLLERIEQKKPQIEREYQFCSQLKANTDQNGRAHV